MAQANEAAVEARGVVTVRIPGPKWLDVEVMFSGREARSVTAKWAEGSVEIPYDVLARVYQAAYGARNAAGDGRAICQLHGFYDGYSWTECSICAEEKRALAAPKVEKLLDAPTRPAPAVDLPF